MTQKGRSQRKVERILEHFLAWNKDSFSYYTYAS